MDEIKEQEVTLNIRYDLPDEIWDKVTNVYASLPGWLGYGKNDMGEDGIPYWFGFDDEIE